MRKMFCLAACLFLSAGLNAAAADINIAVFNLQKTAAECDALTEARAALDGKFGEQKNALEKERTRLEKKVADFQAKKPTAKQQEDFAREQREYGEKAQAFMRLLQADEQRIRQDIDIVISQAAKNLAAAKGYTLVMDIADIVYYTPDMDITADMLAESNAVFKKIKEEVLKNTAPQNAAPAPAPAAPQNDGATGGKAPQQQRQGR
ncbi:MAG: OmpH family outer membrane protein [Desulfovibrio sp.]|jgi:outer membrane protein|nr:OmpH family outer membrane protein [Desulfovibrio sp.]